MFFVFAFVIIVAIVIATVTILHKMEKKRLSMPLERLKKIETRLREYLDYTAEERIKNFSVLRKSLSRLYDLVNEENLNYENADVLYLEQMHCDLGLILYRNEQNEIRYAKVASDGLIFADESKAVDVRLKEVTKKYLCEIKKIKSAIIADEEN